VAILFVINIGFYVTVRLAKVDKIVKEKLSAYLSKSLSAEVQIGDFSFNDRQINVTNLIIIQQDYHLEIPQIYIEYKLLPLLFSGFKNLRSIKQIQIYDPKIEYVIREKKQKKSARKFVIPDLTDYFGSLEIFHGKINLQYQNLAFLKAKAVSLSVLNTRQTKIKFAAETGNSGKIEANVSLKKGTIRNAHVALQNFFPDGFQINAVDSLCAALDLTLDYKKKKFNYQGKLKNIFIRKFDKIMTAENLSFGGNENKTDFNFTALNIDGNPLQCDFSLFDLLSKERKIKAEITALKIPVSKYFAAAEGKISAKISAQGLLSQPQIKGNFSSYKLSAFGQNLRNILFVIDSKGNNISLNLKKAFWNKNRLHGKGSFRPKTGLKFSLYADDLHWQKDNLLISGAMTSDISYAKNNLRAKLNLKNLQLNLNEIYLENFNLEAAVKNDDFSLSLRRPKGDFSMNAEGNIKSKNLKADFKFRRFDLSQIRSSMPFVSGNISVSANPDTISEESVLRIFDKNLIKFDGLFKSGVVLDLKNKHSLVFLNSDNAKYNYEPFSVKLKAEGTLDSIRTTEFSLNDKIGFEMTARLKPKFTFGVSAKTKNLKIGDYMKYFTDYYTAEKFRGLLDFDFSYHSENEGNILGKIKVSKLKMSGMKEINSILEISGDNRKMKIDKLCFANQSRRFADFSGNIKLKPKLEIAGFGKIDNLQLQNIFEIENIGGVLNSEMNFKYDENGENIGVNALLQNFRFNGFRMDSLRFDAEQYDTLFQIEKLAASRKNLFNLNASGAVGYNFLKDENFPDSNSVSVNFKGDLLKMISQQTDFLESGKSMAECNLKIGIDQNGLSVPSCDFSLKNGSLKLQDQLEKLDKITISFQVNNNDFHIEKFKLRMGDGRLYLRNRIFYDEKDLKIAMLNFGRLFVRTNDKGLLVHVPTFTPKNSVAKGVIIGRDSDELLVTGPLDDVHIIGNILVSNANIIYPPSIDNLLKLFTVNIISSKAVEGEFPVNLDLILDVRDNVHYVTHPVDLLINSGGYLHLEKRDGVLVVSDAMFTSDNGSLEMFGTRFKEDFMQIIVSYNPEEAHISGSFYKKTGDGTLITLDIFNSKDKDSKGILQFRLESDDPNDDMLDILSKLRYNRSLDDISVAQRKSMLQDEIIQQAGLELGNAIIEPFIYPVETKLRRWLSLDYFQIQTDIFQNLFIRYYLNKSEEELPQEQPTQSEFDIFLENLTIKLGKYITQNLLCDYEVQLQRPKDLAISSEIGIYQHFSLRYDLPYKFKLSLRFNLMPFKEKNSYEIGLERSFKFW